MNLKYQIFLSSTYDDLIDERDQVIKAILEMGHIPVGMEMFSAADEEQWKIITRQIDESDYYIVIVAHRYGSEIVKGISFTEKEYDYAVAEGVPVLGFIVDSSAKQRPEFIETNEKRREALERFKKKVRGKPVSSWRDASDLHGKVSIALSKAFNTTKRPGWVQSTECLNPQALAQLTQQNFDSREAELLNELVARSSIQHSLMHRGRDLCVSLLAPVHPYPVPPVDDNGETHPHPALRSRKSDITGLLEKMALLFKTVVPPNTSVWTCLRERRADNCYHSFERGGIFTPMRAERSVPLREESLTVQRLWGSLKDNSCVIITGTAAGPNMWEPQRNDGYGEDRCVLMGAVMAKSWINESWKDRETVWILSVCADHEDVFTQHHIPLMQSCVDLFSMIANVVVRSDRTD